MRGSLRLFLQFVFLLFMTLTSRSAWSQDNILPLVAGEKPPALNSYIQYTKDFRGSIHKDGIRDQPRSRGLGDVYKRQECNC